MVRWSVVLTVICCEYCLFRSIKFGVCIITFSTCIAGFAVDDDAVVPLTLYSRVMYKVMLVPITV